MSDETMPAAEATAVVDERDDERGRYEFAFHVLPTVAEGEVSSVFDALKQLITKHGGEIFAEEAPERVDLAYEIVKHLEGRNRSFSSAYFGWVRFSLEPASIPELTAAVEGRSDILRYLLIRLTKMEEAHPFYFHEARKALQQVETIDEQEVVDAGRASEEIAVATEAEADASPEPAVEITDAAKKKNA